MRTQASTGLTIAAPLLGVCRCRAAGPAQPSDPAASPAGAAEAEAARLATPEPTEPEPTEPAASEPAASEPAPPEPAPPRAVWEPVAKPKFIRGEEQEVYDCDEDAREFETFVDEVRLPLPS